MKAHSILCSYGPHGREWIRKVKGDREAFSSQLLRKNSANMTLSHPYGDLSLSVLLANARRKLHLNQRPLNSSVMAGINSLQLPNVAQLRISG